MPSDNVPVVPKRSDPPSGVDIYSRSKAHEISGQDPAFEYQYMEARDERNPHYLGNHTQPQEITDGRGSFAMLDPWVPVEVTEVKQGSKRADDTRGTTRQVTHGTGIYCRRPIANRQKVEHINNLKAAAVAESLTGGQRSGDNNISLKGRVALGTAADGAHAVDTAELLQGV